MREPGSSENTGAGGGDLILLIPDSTVGLRPAGRLITSYSQDRIRAQEKAEKLSDLS